MGSRALLVVAVLAIAGGIAWFALRGPGRSAGSTDRSVALTPTGSGSGRGAISAPAGPALGSGANAFDPPARPALPDAAPAIDAPSHRDVFTVQTRDPAWASRTEDELEDRVRTLTLTAVQRVECRADQCELTITGPVEAVETTIAKLEGPKGLSTMAKSLLLGGPERNGEQLTLRVYALFDRPAER